MTCKKGEIPHLLSFGARSLIKNQTKPHSLSTTNVPAMPLISPGWGYTLTGAQDLHVAMADREVWRAMLREKSRPRPKDDDVS